MRSGKRIWIIYNAHSGSYEDGCVERLRRTAADAGYVVSGVSDCQTADCVGRDELDREDIAIVVILGGDGTINHTVLSLEGWDGAVLPLPGGTANLLCHRLFGNRSPEQILQLLGQDRLAPMRIDCIRCEAGTALTELLAGPGACWADVREEMRELHIAGMLSRAVDAASRSMTGPMVHIVDPALGRAEGYAGVRMTPRDGALAVEGYGAATIGEYFAQGAALLRRDFRTGPHEELGRAARVTCESESGAEIALMLDGERCNGPARMAFWQDSLDIDIMGVRA